MAYPYAPHIKSIIIQLDEDLKPSKGNVRVFPNDHGVFFGRDTTFNLENALLTVLS